MCNKKNILREKKSEKMFRNKEVKKVGGEKI